MISIDAVIESLPTMPEAARAAWAVNAARIIARGATPKNPRHADALRIHNAIAAFEAVRPAGNDLVSAFGLDWDRTAAGRTTFRGFDGQEAVARITRVKPGTFVALVLGVELPRTFATLSAARAAAARAYSESGADDAPDDALPRAA